MTTEEVDFKFPFDPYPVQVSFMKALYETLSECKVGIFESPTGTGKSLSIICGSLAWLREHNKSCKTKLSTEERELSLQLSAPGSGEGDWIAEGARNLLRRARLREVRSQLDYLSKREKKYEDLRDNLRRKELVTVGEDGRNPFGSDIDSIDKERSSIAQLLLEISGMHDEEDIVPDYCSDDETTDTKEGCDTDQEYTVTKVIYCSRTHSQLSQFLKELKKTTYSETTRTVTLGSRNNLCVNEMVTKLGSLSLINDRCLDMQKASASKKTLPELKRTKRSEPTRCPFYKHQAMTSLANNILVQVQDIEEVVDHAKQANACPYYSSRYATPDSELVLIPYNILLQKSAREACKLAVKGNVVIIDEAHNLLETISNIYSTEIRGSNIAEAHRLLNDYLKRYRCRMNTKNVMYLKQLIHLINCFVRYLGEQPSKKVLDNESSMQTVGVFLDKCGVLNLNLFKIHQYLERSEIALKLHSFTKRTVGNMMQSESPKTKSLSDFIGSLQTTGIKKSEQVGTGVPNELVKQTTSSSPLLGIQEFVRLLVQAGDDGRVLVHQGADACSSYLKYILLNPANHFKDVVSEAHAIILAGGTMQPMSEYVDRLLVPAGVAPERIVNFACGHVVPKANLLAIALTEGPSCKTLEFTYQNRLDPEMIQELGRLLVNVVRLVPGGVVCFFPSYEYEEVVTGRWKSSGILENLSAKKHIFHEPSKSSQLEKTLTQYSRCALARGSTMTGALLFAVVGGKMSEGINFSDEMGRCVIMVGLPFPNVKSAEMKAKMDFLDAHHPRSPDGCSMGQVFYNNTCMKAVNQSIGRAIRHKDDYATILLVDQRYQRPSIIKSLPAWIQDSLEVHKKFGTAFAAVQRFFRTRDR